MLPILERLRRPGATAPELKVKLSEVEEALPAAENALADAEAARAAGLLTLTDRDLERIEAEMARAGRDRDRLIAARDELERRVTEAVAAEETARLDRIKGDAEAKAATMARKLQDRYPALARDLVALLGNLEQAEIVVRDANDALAGAGRSDRVAGVEVRAFPPAERHQAELQSVLKHCSLWPTAGAPGFGSGQRVAEVMGLVSG